MKQETNLNHNYDAPKAELFPIKEGLSLTADFSLDSEIQDFNAGEELQPDDQRSRPQ